MAAETTSWEKLRSRARYLEAELERSLPNLVSLVARPSTSGAEESRLSASMEGLLAELRDVADAMAVEVEKAPSAARNAILQRSREVAGDFERERKKAMREVKTNSDRSRLFCGADADDPEAGGEHLQPILKERKHLGNASRGVGDVLDQAAEARSDLAAQRAALEGSELTLGGLVAKLPTVEGVIEAMRQKQTRNNAIIGVTIGCCSSFLLWAVFAQ
ncbi:hypothetical protein JL720_167 [Aureococcus anophagefferens]|nr:hypothetical protein JL720_167 [Aureococcus anophagefferens]